MRDTCHMYSISWSWTTTASCIYNSPAPPVASTHSLYYAHGTHLLKTFDSHRSAYCAQSSYSSADGVWPSVHTTSAAVRPAAVRSASARNTSAPQCGSRSSREKAESREEEGGKGIECQRRKPCRQARCFEIGGVQNPRSSAGR
ncbi:hypothetical protein DENSPDRAFT_384515 [Dentipellis sp. KUC8613]|nr:hypothetical protein DENSPDRAFT_384515 [Dentipellis sp. KUC8613]